MRTTRWLPSGSTTERIVLALAAPAFALVVALLLTSLVLLGSGDPPLDTFRLMLDYGFEPRSLVLTLNNATIYYLSALAVAVGFRMNLFNIGVDGQYRLAAMLSAALGGAVSLPAPLHALVIVLTAMLVGGMWAGIAGLLKATRGVSEVISTIMLNFIATGVVAYLLNTDRLAVQVAGSNNIGTEPIAESGRVPGIPLIPGTGAKVFGLIVLAAACGVAFHVLLNRTRFGFDLRATGRSETAAVAAGVNVRRMIVATMAISGATAGLVGMPQLLGASYSYSLDFPAGLGFIGIAIALLGRNNPVGIAFAAILWGFLGNSAQILDLEGVPKEIVTIMQATIVLSVVVAYELVRRYRLAQEQRRVGRELAAQGQPVEGAAV
jgi:general nucleoside transport system permease protein